MPLLEVKNLRKSFGETEVLKGVSFTLNGGEVLSIIGASGGGKTTLLRCLNFLETPDSGEILVNGERVFYVDEQSGLPVTVPGVQNIMGLVFQQFNLLDEYNVRNNICMPMKLDGRKPDRRFFEEVVDTLRLRDKLKKYPSELSGGEQQRVAIARSILAKPELIIADEPTGNLDKKTGEEVLELLTSCVSLFGQTLIIVTHNPEIAEKADRVITLEDGLVI